MHGGSMIEAGRTVRHRRCSIIQRRNTMKRILILSLSLAACAAVPEVDAVDRSTASVATELGVDDLQVQPVPGATTRSCTNFLWVCESNCPFGGGQNILIANCNGTETVIQALPCSPEGCF
jgi:hypothetical protein